MFVIPFLKYFKPFLGRLIWAIVCMMIVGVLSAAPLLIGREAIDVFVSIGAGKSEDLGDLGGLSSKFIKPSQAREADGAGKKNAVKPRNKLSQSAIEAGQWADATLMKMLGRAYNKPRAWVVAQAETAQAFGITFRALYHLKASQAPFDLIIFFSALIIILTMVKGFASSLRNTSLRTPSS